jgi:hypothetical protein
MSGSEYDDYEPRYPHLLPSGQVEARKRLAEIECLDGERLATLDEGTFLRGWWAPHWLHPGLHPDDVGQWQNEAVVWKPLVAEAYRRFEVGEIADSQHYAAEAVHNRVWIEMRQQ